MLINSSQLEKNTYLDSYCIFLGAYCIFLKKRQSTHITITDLMKICEKCYKGLWDVRPPVHHPLACFVFYLLFLLHCLMHGSLSIASCPSCKEFGPPTISLAQSSFFFAHSSIVYPSKSLFFLGTSDQSVKAMIKWRNHMETLKKKKEKTHSDPPKRKKKQRPLIIR